MTFLEDLYRSQQLVAKHIVPVTRMRKGCQRTHNVPLRLLGSVVRLGAPDAQNREAIDPVRALDCGEGVVPACRAALSGRNARWPGERIDVGLERLAVLRLPTRRREDPRVGRNTSEGGIKRGAADAA